METKRFKQVLKIIIPTLGGGVTVYYALNQHIGRAITSFLISIIWVIGAIGGKFLKEVKDQIDEKLKKRAGVLAEWIVSNLEAIVLNLWWKLTSRFQSNYYKSLVYRYRTYRTEGLKTKGKFALDMAKVFVPLRVAAQSPDLISPLMLQAHDNGNKRLEIWDFLAAIPSQPAYQHIAVIGAPGSGKTTLLEYLSLTYALNTHRQQRRKVPTLIPILLYLRVIRDEITSDQPPTLAQLIESQDFVQQLHPPPNWFSDKLHHKKCIVMLDGLDEVADEMQRNKVSQWINRQMVDYAGTPFILTSRPYGYRNSPLRHVGIVLEVQPFNLKEMDQFIRNWYLQSEVMRQIRKEDSGVRAEAKRQADDLVNRIKDNPSLAVMAVNPLLLTMIATVHDNRGALPGRRVELYAEICDVLLGRRQEAKSIPDPLTAKQKQAVLQVLALELMQRETRQFTLETGSSIIQHILSTVAGTTITPADFLKQNIDVSGLIIERELGVYELAHKSFQEYLAASQVKEVNQEDILIRNIDKTWWEETIRLYAAQSDATNLIRAALSLPSVNALSLARDCIEEGARVLPEVRQQLEDTLEAGLGSDDYEIARLAAEVKLSRRLHKLLRVDERTEIDTSYITCAEYQLFIDEKLKEGQYHQPDHWPSHKYPEGDAAKPVAGVRTSDATDFCEWLNQRYPARDFKYRLPTLTEMEENPITTAGIGSWCRVGKRKFIAGISFNQWRVWLDTFVEIFNRDMAFVLPALGDNELYLKEHLGDLHLDRALDIALARDRAPDRDRAFVRDRDLKRALDMTLDPHPNRNLAYIQDITRAFAFALDIDLTVFNPAFVSAFSSAHTDIDSAFTSARYCLLISCIHPYFNRNKKKLSPGEFAEFCQQLCEGLKRDYPTKSDILFGGYISFVLMTERRQGRMLAWEGIRIVRERIVQ
jgi:hypothetical protein